MMRRTHGGKGAFMAEQVIVCPHCHREIPLTEAISHQIQAKLRAEFDEKSRQRDAEIARREQALAAQAEQLDRARRAQDEHVRAQVEAAKQKLSKEAQQRAQDELGLELKDLRAQNQEKARKLEEAQKQELELRAQRRALEERQQNTELEMRRTLDQEREKIKADAATRAAEEHRLRDLEHEKKISDLLKQLDDLKRKAEQGAVQLQGEVLELELEDVLTAHFRGDTIRPVAKGVRGADVLQEVCGPAGQCCGTIIWESKRTKAWSDGWLTKLREDQRDAKADVAALMSVTLPKEVASIGNLGGVWVCSPACVIGLATALRAILVQVAAAKTALAGRQGKMEALYEYLTGTLFKQRVEGIVEQFAMLRQDLDKEKRSTTALWAKREKQIEQMMKNTFGMYGDMQGIVGASLPELDGSEIKQLTAAPEPERRTAHHRDTEAQRTEEEGLGFRV
jgi:hypothetical protein